MEDCIFEQKSLNILGNEYSSTTPLIIAEAGTSHQGDIHKAKELILAATEAGANVVKFQMVFADEILHPLTGEVPLPGGSISLYERFRSLECTPDFYVELRDFCHQRGLYFACTPFGLHSAEILNQLDTDIFKIASPELNYDQLLCQILEYKHPILLSTGVTRLSDIEHAVELLSVHNALDRTAILHCITAYPAPEEEYNLRLIQTLSAIFGIPCGISDHSLDPILVPSLAVAYGAVCIEKHMCLSRKDSGLDDPVALEPKDFSKMVQLIRAQSTQNKQEVLSTISDMYGTERVNKVLGNGVKKLADIELQNYGRTNRSLHARKALQAGKILHKDDIVCVRTEKKLRCGLPPSMLEKLIGSKLQKDIPEGEGIRLEDILENELI